MPAERQRLRRRNGSSRAPLVPRIRNRWRRERPACLRTAARRAPAAPPEPFHYQRFARSLYLPPVAGLQAVERLAAPPIATVRAEQGPRVRSSDIPPVLCNASDPAFRACRMTRDLAEFPALPRHADAGDTRLQGARRANRFAFAY